MKTGEHRCPMFAMDTSQGFQPADYRCCRCGRVTHIHRNTVAYCPSCGTNLHERFGEQVVNAHPRPEKP